MDSDRPRPTATAVLAIVLIMLSAGLLFGGLPAVARSRMCPDHTFLRGFLGSGIEFPVGLLGYVLCFVALAHSSGAQWREAATWPDFPAVHGPIYRLLLVLGMAASLYVGLHFAFTGFCATPQGIEVHPGLFEPSTLVQWNHVETVTPYCQRGRNHSSGGVRVTVSGEPQALVMTFSNTMTQSRREYGALRAALAGMPYRVRAGENVTASVCPSMVYPLLSNW